jgi:hypothetical protein
MITKVALILGLLVNPLTCFSQNADHELVLSQSKMKIYAIQASKASTSQLLKDWVSNVGVMVSSCTFSSAVVVASGALQSVPIVSVFSIMNQPCVHYIAENTSTTDKEVSPANFGWALGGAVGNAVAICGFAGASLWSAVENAYNVASGGDFNWTHYSFSRHFLDDVNDGAYAPTILLSKKLFGDNSLCASSFHKRALIEAELSKRY